MPGRWACHERDRKRSASKEVQQVAMFRGETARMEAIEAEEAEARNPSPHLPDTLRKIANVEAIGTETEGAGRAPEKGTHLPSHAKRRLRRAVKVTRNENGA
jgi:hypothetical protein